MILKLHDLESIITYITDEYLTRRYVWVLIKLKIDAVIFSFALILHFNFLYHHIFEAIKCVYAYLAIIYIFYEQP